MVARECRTEMSSTSCTKSTGVADGTRTHDSRNHNPGLYQLSYGHHQRTGIVGSWAYRRQTKMAGTLTNYEKYDIFLQSIRHCTKRVVIAQRISAQA